MLYVSVELVYWRHLVSTVAQILCTTLSLFILAFEAHRLAATMLLLMGVGALRIENLYRLRAPRLRVLDVEDFRYVRRVIELKIAGVSDLQALDIEGREVRVCDLESSVDGAQWLVFGVSDSLQRLALSEGADLAELYTLCTSPHRFSEMIGCVMALSTSLERLSSYLTDAVPPPTFLMTVVSLDLLARFRELFEPSHFPLLRWYLSVVASEPVSLGLGVALMKSVTLSRALRYRVLSSRYLCEVLTALPTSLPEIPSRVWAGLAMTVLEVFEQSSIPLIVLMQFLAPMPLALRVLVYAALSMFVARIVALSTVSARSSLPPSTSMPRMIAAISGSTALMVGLTPVFLGIAFSSLIKLIRTV